MESTPIHAPTTTAGTNLSRTRWACAYCVPKPKCETLSAKPSPRDARRFGRKPAAPEFFVDASAMRDLLFGSAAVPRKTVFARDERAGPGAREFVNAVRVPSADDFGPQGETLLLRGIARLWAEDDRRAGAAIEEQAILLRMVRREALRGKLRLTASRAQPFGILLVYGGMILFSVRPIAVNS